MGENSSAAISCRLTWTGQYPILPVGGERRKSGWIGRLRRSDWTALQSLGLGVVLGVALLAWAPARLTVAAGLSMSRLCCLLVIIFLSGVMSGFSGFGFSAIGAVSLVFLPPTLQVPLFQALSTGNQFLSAGTLREEMPMSAKSFWAGPGPCMLGGLIGAPIGIWLLAHLPAGRLTAMFGVLLVGYAAYSLLKPPALRLRGVDSPIIGGAVGLLGGMVGGFTAFPGAPVVVWIGLRGLTKAQHRAVLQPYLIMSQVYALILMALLHPAYLGQQFWLLLALGLPAVVPGTLTGVGIYRRTSDVGFRRVLYMPLAISGVALLAKTYGTALKRLLGAL
jgi:uncharacterized membrane protein YfcA